jgi:hypothetical protein
MDNNITFVLDLSPYMMIFNYGTKSFPLTNLEEITKNLLKKIVLRKKVNPDFHYNISIYLFSIYNK